MPGYQNRLPILTQIEAARNSKAILYVTGDRPGMETQISPEVIDLFADHLDDLWPTEKISLILYTPGGNTAAAWQLVNLLRTFCDDFEVIVPSKALSSGTLISLGANRIVMTKQASLGPIDPSLNGPLNPNVPGGAPNHRAPVSVEAVQGFLDVVQEQLGVKDSVSLASVWNHLSDKIHPLVLGQIFRTRSQIRTLAKRLLVNQVIEDDKKEGIISFLCSESGSHDHSINRREARSMGLVIENPSQDFYEILRNLHNSVSETLKLRIPFSLDTELAGSNQARYQCRRALIESTKHGSHQFISEGEISRISVGTGTGIPQTAFQDSREFEGWRKEA
jgi:Serine dehydrogenase proteinase